MSTAPAEHGPPLDGSSPEAGLELNALARRYLGALLAARRHDAVRGVLGPIERGELGIRELYLGVFEPVLYEVGRLWQAGELTVAEEHFVSAATQLVMSQLYPRIFATARRGSTMVAACVGAELHEIGLRMVADFLELDGWDTYYLGANMPPEAIARAVRERGAELLALSATLHEHEAKTREVIRLVRAEPALRGVRVLVGGGAFRGRPEFCRSIGADGFAADAAGAAALAASLVPRGPSGGAPP